VPPLIWTVRRTESTIDFTAMTNRDDDNYQIGILDGIKNAVVPLAHAIEIVTREFFGSRRTRLD